METERKAKLVGITVRGGELEVKNGRERRNRHMYGGAQSNSDHSSSQ
jgi:hypothetical protein